MPLAMIEVKKPNNSEGLDAERNRMRKRLQNRKFRRFLNQFQLYIFSNNMSGEEFGKIGVNYATLGRKQLYYNNFKEQKLSEIIEQIQPLNEEKEAEILKDNDRTTLKHAPEYQINLREDSPTNQIITSLLSKPRIEFLLKYGITYVNQRDERTGEVQSQKHIMRYPQFFASKAILEKIDSGKKRGIIWHTQGSGKTALTYFSIQILKDYFSTKGIIPKFYFIVDRIDLAKQAQSEFEKRGLKTATIQSKEELVKDFASSNTTKSGDDEICVVNIHKFKDDTTAKSSDYDINVQRIFFIDEAHRSYNPKGSFLANLYNSDKDSIKIALTGTPLIITENGEEGGAKVNAHTTKDIFGEYIHKYYYDESIADGYTLRLIREGIETSYKEKIEATLRDLEVEGFSVKEIKAHPRFAADILDFITTDFARSRVQLADDSIGAMVVCHSSLQAKEIFEIFNEKYADKFSGALILHDIDDKEIRNQRIKEFKDGKIDFLFVYNMLLTGFDAPRLKKLYLARKVKAHNLLQTLTRVNRPYKDFKAGFVVDFANIQEEFDTTNRAYANELNREYSDYLEGDSAEILGALFMEKPEIEAEIKNIKETIFDFELDNLEIFEQQIDAIHERQDLLELKKALESAKNISNLIRLYGHDNLLEKLNFDKLKTALKYVVSRIQMLGLLNSNSSDSSRLLNSAMENVMFSFEKISEEELRLVAEKCHTATQKIRHALTKAGNFDPEDIEYRTLIDAFRKIMEDQQIKENDATTSEYENYARELEYILKRANELNRKNEMLIQKYGGNQKAARVDKRTKRKYGENAGDKMERYKIIKSISSKIDDMVIKNSSALNNEGYFKPEVDKFTSESYSEANTTMSLGAMRYISSELSDEYIKQGKED